MEVERIHGKTMCPESKRKKVIVVMPAYNAEKTLVKTYEDLPKDFVDEIILVDDASRDRTADTSKRLGIKTFVHKKNLGYGANQKTCYAEALAHNADIVVMVHPDYQYDPTLLPEIIAPILNEIADVVLGSRMLIKGAALKGGMPFYKYVGNKILTGIENLALFLNLSEYHTGYRAFSSKVLKNVPFINNSDKFVFDTDIIIQIRVAGFRIKEVPIPTRYFKEASSVDFKQSILYGLRILGRLSEFLIWKNTSLRLFNFKAFPETKQRRGGV